MTCAASAAVQRADQVAAQRRQVGDDVSDVRLRDCILAAQHLDCIRRCRGILAISYKRVNTCMYLALVRGRRHAYRTKSLNKSCATFTTPGHHVGGRSGAAASASGAASFEAAQAYDHVAQITSRISGRGRCASRQKPRIISRTCSCRCSRRCKIRPVAPISCPTPRSVPMLPNPRPDAHARASCCSKARKAR